MEISPTSPAPTNRATPRTLIGAAALLALSSMCGAQAIPQAAEQAGQPGTQNASEFLLDPASPEMPPPPWFLDHNLGNISVGVALTNNANTTRIGVAQRFTPNVTGKLSHIGVWLRNAPGTGPSIPRMTIFLEMINPGSSAIPIASTLGAPVTATAPGGWQFVPFNFTPRVDVTTSSWLSSIAPHNYVFEIVSDTPGGKIHVRGEDPGTYAGGSTLGFIHPVPTIPNIWNCGSLVKLAAFPNADIRFRTKIMPASQPCVPGPDYNGDGSLDGRDYGIFYALDPACTMFIDCDGDGAVTFFDFLCALNNYVAGGTC